MRRRILFSVAGSAGDLFPVIPVMRSLADKGHDVRCALAPRSLALYVRPLGIQTYPLRSGDDASALREPGAITTRFDGWASARHLTHHLLLDSLAESLASLEVIVTTWQPDLIVSASFVPSSRIVARLVGIEQVDVSVYPMLARVSSATRFGWRLRRRCAELAGLGSDAIDTAEVTRLAWGIGPETMLLHDRALIQHADCPWRDHVDADPVGFPYWDEPLHRAVDVESVEHWLDKSAHPSVMVTMGSYLGIGRRHRWTETAEVLESLGLRGLFLGPKRELDGALAHLSGDFHVAGFVPFSKVVGRMAAVVHHGGVGTTFAVLRAATPSVVMPLAFDQVFNARLTEAAGTGLEARGCTLLDSLRQVLTNDSYGDRCRAVSQQLASSDAAVERAAARIVGTTAGL